MDELPWKYLATPEQTHFIRKKLALILIRLFNLIEASIEIFLDDISEFMFLHIILYLSLYLIKNTDMVSQF